MVVEIKPLGHAALELGDVAVFAQVDVFVLKTAPQALDKNVIEPAALAVHADEHAVLFESVGPRCARELAALIRVHDLGPNAGGFARGEQRLFAEASVKRV